MSYSILDARWSTVRSVTEWQAGTQPARSQLLRVYMYSNGTSRHIAKHPRQVEGDEPQIRLVFLQSLWNCIPETRLLLYFATALLAPAPADARKPFYDTNFIPPLGRSGPTTRTHSTLVWHSYHYICSPFNPRSVARTYRPWYH